MLASVNTSRVWAVTALFSKAYTLAKPYGRKRLAAVFAWVLLQGILQVIGVTSIFPLLALAADPDRIRQASIAQWCLSFLPPMDNRALLIWSGLLAIASLLISNAVNLLSEVVRVRYAHGFGHWLRLRLLRQIVSQPYGFFLQNNTSILLKKVAGDVTQYVQGVLLPLLDSAARFITFVLLVLLLFLVDPGTALVAGFGLGGFYVLIFVYLNRRLRATSEAMNEAHRGLFREVNQLLSGIKAVKAHGAEDFFIEVFSRHSASQARLLAWIPVYANGPRYLVEPLAFGGLVAFVLVLAVQGRAFAEVLPVLGVMALAGYRLIPTLQLLYGQIAQLTTNMYALKEVYQELARNQIVEDYPRHVRDQRTPFRWEHAIVLDNVSFSYPGSPKPVLESVSLTIPKNSSTAFIGQTGSGKSTLVDLILGLHRPDSGHLLVDGRELTSADRGSWLSGIGYVPQDIFLLDDTLDANIALGVDHTDIDHQRLREVCAIAQILDFIDNDLPEGFNTMVGERGVRLSGGQRQRIGLARALYQQPEVLVLDEATSALDQETEADLMEALEPLKGSITILIVTHRLSRLNNCDRVYTLPSGRLYSEEPARLCYSTASPSASA
jgi:ATP-binding cassette subfamily C protein